MRGVRTALGITVPLLVFTLLGRSELGLFAAIGGLMIGVTDTGATYPTKARAMLAALGLSCAGMWLGTLAGVSPWLSAPLLGLWAFVFAFSVLFDSSAIMVGWVAIVSFLAGVGLPAGERIADSLTRVEGLLIGGVWMIFLALALWPVNPFRPAFRATAAFYRSLADLIPAACRCVPRSEGAPPWEETCAPQRAAARAAYTDSADVLRATRLTRPTTGPVGRRLVALHEEGFRFFEAIVALAETLDGLPREDARLSHLMSGTDELLEEVSEAMRHIADAVESGGATVVVELTAHLDELDSIVEVADTAIPASLKVHSTLSSLRERLTTLSDLAVDAADNATHLRDRHRAPPVMQSSFAVPEKTRPLDRIRSNMTLDSAAFRHALRLGLTMSVAVVLYTVLDLPKPFWVTLAVVSVVKPDLGGTLDTATQTVVGTILGCSFAAVLITAVTNEIGVILLVIPFAIAGITLAYYNNALFTAGIAPIFVLLSDLSDLGSWWLAGVRIMNTVIGAIIGLIGGYLLWSKSERTEWQQQVARVIRAVRSYFDAVMDGYLNPERTGGEQTAKMRSIHRDAGVELVNAAATTQRLLNQPGTRKGPAHTVMTVSTYANRLHDGVVLLSEHVDDLHGTDPPAHLGGFVTAMDNALDTLADAAESGEGEVDLPDLDRALDSLSTDVDRSASEGRPEDTRSASWGVTDYGVVLRELRRVTRAVGGIATGLDQDSGDAD